MSAERILVDTSVWVEYFRGGRPEISTLLDDLMNREQVYVPALVLAELIQGSRTNADIKIIEDLGDAFTVVDQTPETWIKAGKLSYELRKRGRAIHLTDCYLAIIAAENHCAIFTLDSHFRDIRSVLDIELLSV